jgi:hypothetical protein
MKRDVAMGRLAGILMLAALIVAAGTLFGNEFAPEAMHEEEAAAGAEHSEREEQTEEEDDTSAGQVGGAVLISIGAVALVPPTATLARGRRRKEDVAGAEIAAGPEPGLADTSGAEVAVLSVGAAVIHFAVIAQHFDEWWLTGMFFIVVAVFQLAWAVAVLAWPSRLGYALGAVVNALVVITWIVSPPPASRSGPKRASPRLSAWPTCWRRASKRFSSPSPPRSRSTRPRRGACSGPSRARASSGSRALR